MQTIYEEQQLLPFISNEKLFAAVETIFRKTKNIIKSDKSFYKNSVDPFSAVFDAASADITLEQWVTQEKARQRQKTLQNTIGEFHEEIIGSVTGWERLPVGNLIDVRNVSKKIIGEIKNKHNTTKGSDKAVLYDNLHFALDKPEYNGFTGYYVEIIPKGGATYNKVFTPSDNKTKTRKPENERIRIIDGCSFYEMITGDKHALERLYKVLPVVISDCLGVSKARNYSAEELFHELFSRAFTHK